MPGPARRHGRHTWRRRRTGARFMTTYHGTYGEGAPFKRRYNAVMAKGERVIAISRFIAGLVVARHGIDPARLRMIPRGVDPALFDPGAISGERIARLAASWRLPEGMAVVLLPGRLSRWKGHAVLLDAVATMAARCVLRADGRRRTAGQLCGDLAAAGGTAGAGGAAAHAGRVRRYAGRR